MNEAGGKIFGGEGNVASRETPGLSHVVCVHSHERDQVSDGVMQTFVVLSVVQRVAALNEARGEERSKIPKKPA